MQQLAFDIQLQQPLIISEKAASAGSHQSLDYIPGSVILGLLASRLYAKADSDAAWTIFHSGMVRFGDALPVTNGDTALPVPLNWHANKGVSPTARNELGEFFISEQLFDPSLKQLDQIDQQKEKLKQPKQLRKGYTTLSGLRVNPNKQQTLKTAIDPETGRAAESQLFGYEALEEGQVFRCVISADDIDSALWQRITEAMTGSARLGRSRSAQFGKVYIKESPAPVAPASNTEPGDNILTLWLTSDMLLLNQGQPSLQPDPELLGLPKGTQWLVNQSFLRTRRYSLYNAFRRHYDCERQVICRGSVLRFKLEAPLSAEQMTVLQAGIGANVESGLGQVMVNPGLLAQSTPVFEAQKAVTEDQQPTVSRPNSLLIQALKRRHQPSHMSADTSRLAKEIFAGLCQRIREARGFLATPVNEPVWTTVKSRPVTAPGRSQWGRLKELANNHRQDPQQLWSQLTSGENPAIADRSGWELPYGPQSTIGIWLRQQLESQKDKQEFPALIGQLAALGLQPRWEQCCLGKETPKASSGNEQGAHS